MHCLPLRALALIVPGICPSLLCAQAADRGHVPLIAMERAELLNNKSVQQEINLTPEQLDRLKRAAADWEAKHRTDVALSRKGDDFIKAMEVRRAALLELYRTLPAVLSPKQLQRLNQIHLQVQGALAFVRPQVWQRLGLTEAQIAAIRPITTSVRQQIDNLGPPPGDPRVADARMAERLTRATNRIQKAGMARIMQVFTPEQREKWTEMVGEPFELKWGTARQPAARDNP